MLVSINWTVAPGENVEYPRLRNPLWNLSRVLYLYTDIELDEVLYIGKAVNATVKQRWDAPDKMAFWRSLEKERGIHSHITIVGQINLQSSNDFSRVTPQIIADVESLLIHQVNPWGNIQCARSRNISRPGMKVTCSGAWPLRQRTFVDFPLPLLALPRPIAPPLRRF